MTDLKGFWKSQIDFEMVQLYKNKLIFTQEQVLFYSVTGAFIYKQRTLAIFFTVLLR